MWVSLFLLFFVPFASAHLDAGDDVQVEDYTLDMGYSPSAPIAGEKVTLSFVLEDEDVIRPDHVWLRISNEKTLFSGKLRPDATNTTLITYVFAEPGDYELLVSFREESSELARNSFHLQIGKRTTYLPLVVALVLLVGFFVEK